MPLIGLAEKLPKNETINSTRQGGRRLVDPDPEPSKMSCCK